MEEESIIKSRIFLSLFLSVYSEGQNSAYSTLFQLEDVGWLARIDYKKATHMCCASLGEVKLNDINSEMIFLHTCAFESFMYDVNEHSFFYFSTSRIDFPGSEE